MKGRAMPESSRQLIETVRRTAVACGAVCLFMVLGCGLPFPGARAPAAVQHDGCHIHGRIVSTALQRTGGGIKRAIVRVWTVPNNELAHEVYGEGEPFEVWLKPGKYKLVCSANGIRGETFEVLSREIAVDRNEGQVDLGQIDLPISKTTRLYGQPAPELEGVAAWQDTAPLTLKGLRGQVVVLDFFAYYCTICHAHKPDLMQLLDRYGREGLVVLAVHDNSVPTLDEMNQKLQPALRGVFHGEPPRFPIALDGPGAQGVFASYGMEAVPAVILIDQQGRVVRRYHHAGVPELEADVRALLKNTPKWQL
jgi:thiol-disulfide isomerase/thioredoxin